MTPQRNKFPATVIIIIIFAGAIFLLSGLCTGIFAWDAEINETGGYTPNHWYEALFIGSFALIPSGLMLWAALRQMRRGANKISGIIFLIGGVLSSLLMVMSLISSVSRVLYVASRSNTVSQLPSAIIALVIIALLLAVGLWLVYIGVKILRDKGAVPNAPETFN